MVRRKTLICIVLQMLFLLYLGAVLTSASGIELETPNNPIPEEPYEYIMTCNSSIFASGNILTCIAQGRGKQEDTITVLYAYLEKRMTGTSSWSSAVLWSTTASGTALAKIVKTYPMTSGFQYRLHVVCRIKDAQGNLAEKADAYSAIYTY